MVFSAMAKNQTIVSDGNQAVFYSYDKKIAVKESGQVLLDSKYWNFSKTTSKYRSQFLSEGTQATQEKIDGGIYKLVNLN